jgi:hypothetical protein
MIVKYFPLFWGEKIKYKETILLGNNPTVQDNFWNVIVTHLVQNFLKFMESVGSTLS